MSKAGTKDSLDVSALMAALLTPRVLSLALADGAAVTSTPLFYATQGDQPSGGPILWWASSPQSHHGRLLGRGPTAAAASLYEDPGPLDQLRGVQCAGIVRREDGLPAAAAAAGREHYLRTHPKARPLLDAGAASASAPHLYAMVLTWAKLTDNARLGPGHHEEWTFQDAFETLESPSGVS